MRILQSCFSRYDIFDAVSPLQNYENLMIIGNGAYGTVYRGTNKFTQEEVAMKRVKIPLSEEGIPVSTLREISLLKQLDQYEHPNIVRLLDVCQGEREKDVQVSFYLIFQHIERDLATYLEEYSNTGISKTTVMKFTHQILCGIDFLHCNRILHRDLKPQNILIGNDGTLKLADFGLAKTYHYEMRLTSVVVTLWYRSPEVLLGTQYGTPLDVWSVGCVMGEMMTCNPLFPGTSEGDQLDKIFRIIGTPEEPKWPSDVSVSYHFFPQHRPVDLSTIIQDLDEEEDDLLKRMLCFDPHRRISATEALRHNYFNESGLTVPHLTAPDNVILDMNNE